MRFTVQYRNAIVVDLLELRRLIHAHGPRSRRTQAAPTKTEASRQTYAERDASVLSQIKNAGSEGGPAGARPERVEIFNVAAPDAALLQTEAQREAVALWETRNDRDCRR